jgi:hypothetical protein
MSGRKLAHTLCPGICTLRPRVLHRGTSRILHRRPEEVAEFSGLAPVGSGTACVWRRLVGDRLVEEAVLPFFQEPLLLSNT